MARRKLTIAELLSGALKAAKSTTKPKTELSETRLRVCASCPMLDERDQRCTQCGCPVRRKVKLPEESCPLGFW